MTPDVRLLVQCSSYKTSALRLSAGEENIREHTIPTNLFPKRWYLEQRQPGDECVNASKDSDQKRVRSAGPGDESAQEPVDSSPEVQPKRKRSRKEKTSRA